MSTIPYGYCQCGCGQKTRIAPQTHREKGWVCGEPLKYVKWHKPPPTRNGRRLDPEYIEEDQGFDSPCWIAQYATSSDGHCRVRLPSGESIGLHRLYYEERYGPIPEGMEPDHLCGRPACINPEHLEPVTHAENVRRGVNVKLSHEKAREIRRLYAQGDTSYAKLAKKYGVTSATIGRIILRQAWA